MEKYCSYCDCKIFDDDRTCPQCGAPIKKCNRKESKTKIFDPDAYQSLKTVGWSQQDFIALSQKVSAFNGGKKTTVVCNKKCLTSILPHDINYRYYLGDDPIFISEFFGCHATTNTELLRRLQLIGGGTENTIYVACVDNELNVGNIIGMIEI